ncbi:MAG: MFS transporter [Legionella sp.]|uniref:MFS transporter n=1 Tax=Legionella sp. TaxID=459 RepID=UPI0039E47860
MKKYCLILSSSLGSVIEWYDFGLFTLFSPLFSKLFFSGINTQAAIWATLSVFTVGVICRPLGALLFGYLGDKYGHGKTLRWSILMIALPTFIIGFLPTYQQVGVLAPILLTLVRLWQGISIGGEYSGNIIYLAESAPKNYRATFTAFASMGANTGILLAALSGLLMSQLTNENTLAQWGWRVPYIFGGILSLVIYFSRLNLSETNIFAQLKQNNLLAKDPVKNVFKYHLSELLRTIGLVCMGSTFYCFTFIYLPIFLSQKNNFFSLHQTSILMSFLLVLMIMLMPLAGLLCDKLGRKPMLLFTSGLIIFGVIPGFICLQYHWLPSVICILLFFTLASSLEQGATPITIVENFPAATRYTGISLGYNIGNGLIGGTVPLISEWLMQITQWSVSPAIYIALYATITGSVVCFFIPETRGNSLLR